MFLLHYYDFSEEILLLLLEAHRELEITLEKEISNGKTKSRDFNLENLKSNRKNLETQLGIGENLSQHLFAKTQQKPLKHYLKSTKLTLLVVRLHNQGGPESLTDYLKKEALWSINSRDKYLMDFIRPKEEEEWNYQELLFWVFLLIVLVYVSLNRK